jgi:cysteinyl-tRNA synthetase
LDFDDEKLQVAAKGLDRLKTALRLAKEAIKRLEQKADEVTEGETASAIVSNEALLAELAKLKGQFMEAMDDDFNTALAIAVLFDTARTLNGFVSSVESLAGTEALAAAQSLSVGLKQLLDLSEVLGLELAEAEEGEDPELQAELNQLLNNLGASAAAGIAEQMAALLDLRQQARQGKDFAKADQIRDGLKKLNIQIEDTAQGPRWHRG